ncbi:hypothetical protein [Hyalangium sp.]|uniref:hypothetical protein n=1 Tax=Hyalangium sp. TaxID=2028555 RepID=UPI002D49FEB3|nr:hypothetical protein [Hyalangium sp.]HYH97240.1 hypothetical protein [Hyalangium sp.]
MAARKAQRSKARAGSAAGKISEHALVGARQLQLRRGSGEDVVEILEPAGTRAITLTVNADTIVISVEGGSVVLRTAGSLRLEAEQLDLHGRRGVNITSEGDARIAVAGNVSLHGRAQELVAHRGSVSVTASDDVKLDGERIMLNS